MVAAAKGPPAADEARCQEAAGSIHTTWSQGMESNHRYTVLQTAALTTWLPWDWLAVYGVSGSQGVSPWAADTSSDTFVLGSGIVGLNPLGEYRRGRGRYSHVTTTMQRDAVRIA
jgi:hypothetical protein